MKKVHLIILLFAVSGAALSVAAQNPAGAATVAEGVSKTTFRYAVHDGVELFLDRYTASAATETATATASTAETADAAVAAPLRPCVIFVFGGGFFTGTRDAAKYAPFFGRLAESGCDVVSIDYRLGMRGVSNPNIFRAVLTLSRTVDMAVEDLSAATVFVLEHAHEWGIDPARIVACGSSAGAITVLQAENGLCNGSAAVAALPEGFDYGGVISFAGAIFSMSGAPSWRRVPCPMLLFHGTSDSNVPYRRGSLLGVGFYGSATIAEQLHEMGSPYIFYSVDYGDHSLAEDPMNDNFAIIERFIRELVVARRSLQVVERICDSAHADRRTEFSISDYLGSNYNPR